MRKVEPVLVEATTAAAISTPIPPDEYPIAPPKVTVVSLSALHSLKVFTSGVADPEAPKLVNPVPTVKLEESPFVAVPYVALLVSEKAASVTVKVAAACEASALVADWTIAPEPFVPLVSTPENWSTVMVHESCVFPPKLAVKAPAEGEAPNALNNVTVLCVPAVSKLLVAI